EVDSNRNKTEYAVRLAAAAGADIVITPETAIPGYHFANLIGTDWIEPQPDSWLKSMADLAGELKINIFLGYQERDTATGKLYNTVFSLCKDGQIAGSHRKMGISADHTAEAWATAGEIVDVIHCDGFKAGVLICADTWGPKFAAELKEKGAQVLISPAAWPPLPCPPEGCWEKRSAETGLPIWVCNRTGSEPKLDFTWGESIVAAGGKRVLEYSSEQPAVLLFDWDIEKQVPIQTEFEIVPIV
ncbi:MAG: carbon-nitrogen hydrolase family protein, partial [Dehalococcoidia bacterium]